MIQVCLQALCLEEMTGRDVPQGVIFYAASRRRSCGRCLTAGSGWCT
jgi:CRISPR/Cas system-associated exonuclease Cas4 (RecB family)